MNELNQKIESYKDNAVVLKTLDWLKDLSSNASRSASSDCDATVPGPSASTAVWTRVQHSLAVIACAMDTFPRNQLALSFNGGKDNCVLLHLLACFACMASLEPGSLFPSTVKLSGIESLYWTLDKGMPEVANFMAECATQYSLRVRRLEHTSFVEGLNVVAATTPVKAIFMGQRRTDPHAQSLVYFAMTDAAWPQFVRINPLLDWTYSDIWSFTLAQQLPICPLYRQGFTSLGAQHSTKPNPHLLNPDRLTYRPAWFLENDDWERAGR